MILNLEHYSFFPQPPTPFTHLPFLSYSSSLAAVIHSQSHPAAGLHCLLVQWDLLIKSADGKPRGTMFNRWAQRRGFHSTTLAQSTGHFFWEKCVHAHAFTKRPSKRLKSNLSHSLNANNLSLRTKLFSFSTAPFLCVILFFGSFFFFLF